MKYLKYIGYFLLITMACLIITACYFYYSTTTSNNCTVKLNGLHGKVIITRDQYGVPHINALNNDDDAFFALGYVHAQDRLWQMEFQRRIAQGRLSELFGAKTIKQDKLLRTFGFYRAARSAWPAFNPKIESIMKAYTAGVNAFIAQDKLPLQFKLLNFKPEPWNEIDGIAWEKMMAFDLQHTWDQAITNYLIAKQLGPSQINILKPSYPKNAPTILSTTDLQRSGIISSTTSIQSLNSPNNLTTELTQLQIITQQIRAELGFSDVVGKGSNNWVINGKRTTTGKPILANDPHLSLSAPGVWYLAEIRGPHLHVIGGTLPGTPLVALGHNDHIAWGATNVDPDTQDLYVEPANVKLNTIHEIIKVKNQADINLPVQFSEHGPIISNISDAGKIGPRVALKWTALMPGDTTLQSFMKLNFANNWQDFVNAMKDFVVPSQNFIYADTQGNIGYYMPGHIPIRNGWSSVLPVPGTGQYEWQGYIPFEKLPHALNPTENFIATANNKIAPDSYPYTLSPRWREPAYRIERIYDLLNAKKLLSMQDVQNIQSDTVSYLWRDLKPYLLATKPLDNKSKIALESLKNWNGNNNLNSRAATVFAFWYSELTKMANLSFTSNWNQPYFIRQQLADNGTYCRINKSNTCTIYLSQSLQLAMNNLTQQLGNNSNNWQWGNIHRVDFIEQGVGESKQVGWIWNRSIATPGSFYTINVGTYNFNTFKQTDGPGYRQIIDFSHFDNSLYIQSFGQSDDPLSKYHANLMELWRDNKYILMSSNSKDWGKTEVLTLSN